MVNVNILVNHYVLLLIFYSYSHCLGHPPRWKFVTGSVNEIAMFFFPCHCNAHLHFTWLYFFSIIPVHHKYSLGNIKLLSLNYYTNSKFKSVSVNFCELRLICFQFAAFVVDFDWKCYQLWRYSTWVKKDLEKLSDGRKIFSLLGRKILLEIHWRWSKEGEKQYW